MIMIKVEGPGKSLQQGSYIRRELKALPDGRKMVKEEVVNCAIQSGLLKADPEAAAEQMKLLPFGFQITSIDKRAHIKVQLGSGLVEICGKAPATVLPAVVQWTTECSIPPRSNKKRR